MREELEKILYRKYPLRPPTAAERRSSAAQYAPFAALSGMNDYMRAAEEAVRQHYESASKAGIHNAGEDPELAPDYEFVAEYGLNLEAAQIED